MRVLSDDEIESISGCGITVTGPGTFDASAGTTTVNPNGSWSTKTNDGWTAAGPGGGGGWVIYRPDGSEYARWA